MKAFVTKIIVSIANRGLGVEDDPVRNVWSLFTLDGELIAEFDPQKGDSHPDIRMEK